MNLFIVSADIHASVCNSTIHLHTYVCRHTHICITDYRAAVSVHVLYLLISHILSTVGGGLFHCCQTEDLQQVVLHHIPKRGVVEGGGGKRLRTVASQWANNTNQRRGCA